jgi:short-subunit dehydrogenase
MAEIGIQKRYAVITGASKGLGRALATEVSKRGMNTLLVSLPGEDLETVCREMRDTYGTDSRAFETDLSVNENVIELASKINTEFEVMMLINNAGIGGSKRFMDADVAYVNRIVQLNAVCTALLTHQLLPNLMRQKEAYILNVASIAAVNPTGFKTVYPASKAFVYSFSLGLYEELRGSGVHVSVVCPGAMPTNAEIIKRIEHQRFYGKLILGDTAKIAKRCIKGLMAKKPLIRVNFGIWILSKLLPMRVRVRLITRTVRKESE